MRFHTAVLVFVVSSCYHSLQSKKSKYFPTPLLRSKWAAAFQSCRPHTLTDLRFTNKFNDCGPGDPDGTANLDAAQLARLD